MKINKMKKIKNYCVYLYQKYPTRTIFGVISMFFIFLLSSIIDRIDITNVWETLQSIAIIYTLYIFFFIISLPVLREIGLYIHYHMTLNNLKNLEYSIENHSDKTVQVE